MESKKVAISEQILSPRRKVVSGFGFCIIASIVALTIMALNISFKSPLVNPMLQGLNSKCTLVSRSFCSPPSSSSGTVHNTTIEIQKPKDLIQRVVQNNTHDSNGSKKKDFLVSKNGEVKKEETHLVGNSSEIVNNGELIEETHVADDPEIAAKNGNFTVSNGEGAVTEKTHLGNFSEIGKNESFPENSKDDDGKINATISYYDSQSSKMRKGLDMDCDIFDGRWVRDDSKPYYPSGSCPYIDMNFDCHLNGRPDDGFLKWKWQPNGCDIPSLNATDFLERLRGKKLVFVGDSLNRNMWESLVCILRHSIKDKKKVYEISGRTEFKKKGVYSFRFEDYKCTVDFVSAPFLVSESTYKGKNGTFETLRLDLMDRMTSMYHDADVIVFNTGHWWTHEKTSRGEDYYQEGNYVHPRLKVLEAYKKALTTWAKWVDKNIDRKRTQVFFRGYSVTHFRGGQWNSGGQCHKEVEPIFNETYLAKYPSKMRALQYVLKDMETPVSYLNISRLTDYRKDGHPSIYRMEYKTPEERISAEHSQDCSHWCLPGVPDTWNELLYASLLKAGKGSWKKKS